MTWIRRIVRSPVLLQVLADDDVDQTNRPLPGSAPGARGRVAACGSDRPTASPEENRKEVVERSESEAPPLH